MRILIVSFYFPPYNAIGAVRLGKLAKYLVRHGHEVKVLSANFQQYPLNLPLEIPRSNVHYSGWFDVNALFKFQFLSNYRIHTDRTIGKGSEQNKSQNILRRIFRVIWSYFTGMFNIPDAQFGWYRPGLLAGRRLLSKWTADLIYASARPYTSLYIGNKLSRDFSIPWFAEFRDLWTDNQDYPFPSFRKPIDQFLEKRVLDSVSGLITVSDQLANRLHEKFYKPIEIIYNGFDPTDYPSPQSFSDRTIVDIVYTGTIYESKQSPLPIFQALKILSESANKIRICFYGIQPPSVLQMALDSGVNDSVEFHRPISYLECLKRQREADALLYLSWNDSSHPGVITGKLFEYIGARRPIIAVGYPQNAGARIIQEKNLGFVSNDPSHIAEYFHILLKDKFERDRSPDFTEIPEEFTREAQTKRLEKFLEHNSIIQLPRRHFKTSKTA